MNAKIVLMCVCITVLLVMLSSMVTAGDLVTTVSAGLSLTDGNSKTLQANAGIVSEGEKDQLGSVRFVVEANYGESTTDDTTETTVENAKVFGNAKKTLSEKIFAYFDTTFLYDDIALIDYRATAGPGFGLYLIKKKTTKFFVESGLSYVWEEVADMGTDYLAVRIGERFDHTFNGRGSARIWQSIEYLPKANDLSNYLINAEAGAEAALNTDMNLRLVLRNKYDSEASAALKKNDLSLIAGISIKL